MRSWCSKIIKIDDFTSYKTCISIIGWHGMLLYQIQYRHLIYFLQRIDDPTEHPDATVILYTCITTEMHAVQNIKTYQK